MENNEVLVSNGHGLQSVKQFNERCKAVCFLKSVITVCENDTKTKKEKRSTGFYAKVRLVNGDPFYGVFTNNHVLRSEAEAVNTTATFCYDDEGQLGKSVKLRPYLIFKTDKVLDYTFAGIDKKEVDDLQLDITPIFFDNEGNVEVGDIVGIPQHPKGRPKEISYEKVTKIERPFVYYKADTETGSSGSPVMKNLEVIAVHHKGNEEELYNKGTLCSEILSHLNTGTYTFPTAALMDSQDKEIYEGKRPCDYNSDFGGGNAKKPKVVNAAFKPGCPTESELNNLAPEIVQDWKMLGRQLDLPNSKINEIQRDNINFSGIVDKAREMLQAWYDKGEKCATYVALGTALNNLGKCRLAKEYCNA